VRSRENFSDRLHEGITDDDGDIGSRVSIDQSCLTHPDLPFCELSEMCKVRRGEPVRRGTNVELEHPSPGLDFG
jgi:hypothetical protein